MGQHNVPEVWAIVVVRVWADESESKAAKRLAARNPDPVHQRVATIDLPSGRLVLMPSCRSGSEVDATETEALGDDGSSGLAFDVPPGSATLFASKDDLKDRAASGRWWLLRPDQKV